jgi:anti-anti-sigma factor
MDIVETREGAVTVVKPMGPLLLGEAEQFKTRLTDVIARSLGRFVIDASQVAYLDSRGLEVLVEASEQMSQSGQPLRVCGSNETLREVMDLTETAPLFEHFADVHAALRSFE